VTETADYANATGRPTGAVVAVLARLVPGIGRVQRQIPHYARAWHEANRAALTSAKPRWIVLGDSMSIGVGASRFDAGWVNQLHDRLAADGTDYAIVNLAASGARVSDVIAQQLPALRALPPRTDTDPTPDLVTVLIGSNDLFRRAHRERLPEDFAALLAELPPGTVVASMPQPRAAAIAVNDEIKAAPGIVIADLRSGAPTSWKGRLADDHFHPNNLGYAGIAATFYDAINRHRVETSGSPMS
jgi:lysophospholipase L1-like esterase